MAVRVVQCRNTSGDRIVALVDGDRLRVLDHYRTLYDFVDHAIYLLESLEELVTTRVSNDSLDYSSVYSGKSEWKLLPPFDHPKDPAHCLITGTGLSHRKSADNRNKMHSSGGSEAHVTDSMRMYHSGEQGGRPDADEIGTAPEWFWKGDGAILRAHGDPLEVPGYGEDGGEEAEIAGIYMIGPHGKIFRVGFAAANEFSDHEMESHSYLHLAPSKLRQCSIGPEIVIGGSFADAAGEASVVRDGRVIWSQQLCTGEANMVHSLSNLEHHHFKYAQHRREGDVHIHFFGTPGFSFGSGVTLEDGDEMTVKFEAYGRPLVNPIRINHEPQDLVGVEAL